jgi:hypothetical protein
MDVDEAKTAILKRLCYDYKRYGRGFSLAASALQNELQIPAEVFNDAVNALIAKDMFVERVPFESSQVRLTEAGTLRCK